jgi:hypothetical protein
MAACPAAPTWPVSWGVALSETLSPSLSAHPLAPLHDPATIRVRCTALMQAVERDLSPSFKLRRDLLPAVADRVAALTLRRFPTLEIPLHSRWRHFEAGGVDRKAELDQRLAGRSGAEVARVHFDLSVVSVLLDAGAGPSWHYTESTSLSPAALPQAAPEDLLALLDQAASARARPAAEPAATPAGIAPPARYQRSEGLAVASFRAFMAGAFSSSGSDPLRADAAALRHVDAAALRAIFQSSPSNPMVGLDGRAALLSRLGGVLQQEAARDTARGQRAEARPGLLFDRLSGYGTRQEVPAAEVLGELLRTLSPIWPSGSKVQGLAAGDVWPHLWAGAAVGGGKQDRTTEGWVPFHKLSQWLSYSLFEPLQWADLTVTGLDALTGLPEYRNGGLFIDAGVIEPRHPRLLARTWKPQDEFIIEWRALTVVLLDELAVMVRQRLGKTSEELPLARILEGGTWAAGREIARELRPDGSPPLRIESDGTIF